MRRVVATALACALGACGETSQVPADQQAGADPVLPPPVQTWLPTVHIAPAKGWPEGRAPIPAPGFSVNAFHVGLDHPRWLHVLPNGDVLVAETNGPKDKGGVTGLKGAAMKRVMARAGAGVPSADRLSLLRDVDGDGLAEVRTAFLEQLSSPFGMALVGEWLYVANADHLVRVRYAEGMTQAGSSPERVAELPGAGKFNHHWTKSLLASPDGQRLYVGVGSNSNVAEHGMQEEELRANVLEIVLPSGHPTVYASGLRNPVGMDWQPDTGALWVVVNERDELGSDLVPDYLTSVRPGAFYGWPYSYYGQHVDARVQPPRPDLFARAIAPDYALGAHVAPLGLAFYTGALLPARYRHGAFIGMHGSWNRRPYNGYRVAFVPFAGGVPAGPIEDVLTGFIDDDGRAMGRPAGVAIARDGALLVADDVGNTVWRVAPGSARRE